MQGGHLANIQNFWLCLCELSLYKYSCFNKYKIVFVIVLSHILKLVITDVTYSRQLLYSSVIVYVIEFYSIHCTKSHFNTMFVCFVVRGESPGCRLFGTASMLEWLRNRSTDTCSPDSCSPSKWKSGHLLTSEFLIRKLSDF